MGGFAQLPSNEAADHDSLTQSGNAVIDQISNSAAFIADVFLIDAVTNLGLHGMEIPIIKGDATSYAIAAASIVAKVTRDRQMIALDSRYPQYGFARHKGYGTAEHLAALRQYGPLPEHRRSFLKKLLPSP